MKCCAMSLSPSVAKSVAMLSALLQETKITNGIYTRGSAGYKVIATDALSRHRGGIALFYRPTTRFAVEEGRD